MRNIFALLFVVYPGGCAHPSRAAMTSSSTWVQQLPISLKLAVCSFARWWRKARLSSPRRSVDSAADITKNMLVYDKILESLGEQPQP
jgi:hypothetical protein